MAGAAVSHAVAGPRAVRSLFVWGCYLTVLGGVLLVSPNTLLALFKLPPTQEVWVRVVAMLTLILAYTSFMAARTANAEYMRWSVTARAAVPVFIVSYFLLGWAPAALLPFGAVDLAGSLWTRWALARDSRV